jgi:chemotaxis protein CheZ
MKRYRIEEMLGTASPVRVADAGEVPVPVAQEMAAVLSTLKELRQILDPGQTHVPAKAGTSREDLAEVYELRGELETMKRAITSTKREIAAIYWGGFGHGLERATSELDAVVLGTEQATTAILAAAEEIEANASMLRASGTSTGNNDCLGAILDRVVTLYETCNFQDLTGQRITKIVKVLKFVEDRLDVLIKTWGGLAAFKDFVDQDVTRKTAESGRLLLHGPKLDGEPGHVSQSDIDALFG